MKILQVFNQYRFRGGEEAWVDVIPSLLGDAAEVEELRFHSDEWLAPGGPSSFRQALLMADNPISREKLRNHVKRFGPDLVLFHNVIPVGSFGLYSEAKELGLPILQYTHNFRPFSPGGTLWTGERVDDSALHGNPWPEILNGAWQGSRIRTAVLAAHLKFVMSRGFLNMVDRWVAPSEFMRRKFIEAGIEPDRCILQRHCMAVDAIGRGGDEGDYYLFLGRLVSEKGVHTLLDAWRQLAASLGARCPKLIIAGNGPEEEALRAASADLPAIHFAGFVEGLEKANLIQCCRALLVPSIWWEPLGLTAYEAYSAARPVIAARSGALQETVQSGTTGWHHDAGSVNDLARAVVDAERAGVSGRRLRGEAGLAWLKREADPGQWKQSFIELCSSALRSRNYASITPTLHSSIDVPAPPPHHNRSEPLAASPASPASRRTKANGPAQLHATVYLADQNPGYDRSFGISRMSHVVLNSLKDQIQIEAVVSRTSQRPPPGVAVVRVLPWGTRHKSIRLLTDHLYPLSRWGEHAPDIHYFPKGYLPLLSLYCKPSVVTIHDTIIQYDEDHYPDWRNAWEYRYWAMMLKHTLYKADRILTVSESSKRQILEFMTRHGIPLKEITVTYESCLYEHVPQPAAPPKENYVIHLASCEPHKRTAHLVRWWSDAEAKGKSLPMLHLIGTVPPEVQALLARSRTISKRPFLEDAALQAAYMGAKALILPSEIEGFGLPALEAYYLGTPVCFVKGTSVEEVLAVATSKGGFTLDSSESLFQALDEVMAMTGPEVRDHGLTLRDVYASRKVAQRMVTVFREVADRRNASY